MLRAAWFGLGGVLEAGYLQTRGKSATLHNQSTKTNVKPFDRSARRMFLELVGKHL